MTDWGRINGKMTRDEARAYRCSREVFIESF
jgi:hypothetical protein